MKESRCRWGEAPWKRVGGEQRRELLLRSSTGSFAFDAELPSPPLPPFLYRAHVKARRGNSQLPWDWPQQHFSPFFYILTFRSFEVSDGVFSAFLLIFSFSELWKWVCGWSLRSRGTDPAEAKESPWSPFARVNVRHSINRNKDFSRANKQKLLCATKCRSILKFSLVSPFSFSSWSPVVSSNSSI